MIALQGALIWPLEELLRIGVEYRAATALFRRVLEYLDMEVEIVESATPLSIEPGTARGSVQFQGVSFRCDKSHRDPTLQDIDLTIPAGSHVGIVGATGSGKSTLGYLLARLYDVDAGAVTVDGVDVRDLRFASLASVVGVVTQEVYLFNVSVADNLRFAKEDASDADLIAAATAARRSTI